MRESLLKKVANWLMDKTPDKKSRNKTIQSLRDEFDSWINRPRKKKSPRKLNYKRRSIIEGQMYAESCEMKYGKDRRNQNA